MSTLLAPPISYICRYRYKKIQLHVGFLLSEEGVDVGEATHNVSCERKLQEQSGRMKGKFQLDKAREKGKRLSIVKHSEAGEVSYQLGDPDTEEGAWGQRTSLKTRLGQPR